MTRNIVTRSLGTLLAATVLVIATPAVTWAEDAAPAPVSPLDELYASVTCSIQDMNGELDESSVDDGGVNWGRVGCFMNRVDPDQQLRDLRQGAVILEGNRTNQHLNVIDPKQGGDKGAWAYQDTMRQVWSHALSFGGAEDGEATYDQALEWALGVVGCADSSNESGGEDAGAPSPGGDWLTPGTEKFEVAQKIFDRLTQEYGTSGAFAAGVLGNVEQESSFNVDITNSIGAKGLFQFLPASKAEPWMKGGSWSVENQVDAVWGLEFSNRAVWPYVERNAPGTFDSLEEWLSTDDAEAAARAFLLGYERPGSHEAMEEKRKQNAAAANKVFNKDSIKANPKKFKLDGSSGEGGESTDSETSGGSECATVSMGDADVVGGWTIPTTKPESDAGITVPGSNNGGWWSTYAGEAQHAAGATDWIRPIGTPARAAAAGKVVDKYCGTHGCFLAIEHTPTLFTIYGHIASDLKAGDTVEAGQDLGGMVDLSSYPSPPHVHFAVSSVWQQDVSRFTKSVKFLKDRGVTVGPARAGDPTYLAE